MILDIYNKIKGDLRDFILITLGTVIMAGALGLFLLPNHIASGGFSGIAFLIHYITGFPIGVMVFIMNVPLFLIAKKRLGNRFIFKSMYGIIIFTLMIDFIPFQAVTQDGFLACIYGGVIIGLGIGLVFAGHGSTGGNDMVTQVLHHRWPYIKEGTILAILDAIVVIAAALLTGLERALYSLVSLFVTSWLIGIVTEGIRRAKVFLIVTEKPENIKSSILFELNRGVTELSSTGGYTGSRNYVLFCVLESPAEVWKLKEIIKKKDPRAFMVALDAREVLGEGFKR